MNNEQENFPESEWNAIMQIGQSVPVCYIHKVSGKCVYPLASDYFTLNTQDGLQMALPVKSEEKEKR